MLSKTLSSENEKSFFKIVPELSIALLAIVFWLGITDWLEIYITEWHYIRNDIPDTWDAGIFVLLIIIAAFIATHLRIKSSLLKNFLLVLSITLFLSTLVGHYFYKRYYSWLQTFPKIKHISKSWSIHGDRIAIVGRNFGGPWQTGSIWVNDVQYIIVSWNDERVVAEQPITGKFSEGELILKNEHGNTTTVNHFEIKNPSEVL